MVMETIVHGKRPVGAANGLCFASVVAVPQR